MRLRKPSSGSIAVVDVEAIVIDAILPRSILARTVQELNERFRAIVAAGLILPPLSARSAVMRPRSGAPFFRATPPSLPIAYLAEARAYGARRPSLKPANSSGPHGERS